MTLALAIGAMAPGCGSSRSDPQDGGAVDVGMIVPDAFVEPDTSTTPDASPTPDACDSCTVSFTRDLFPTVRDRCAIAGCHDNSNTPLNHFTDFTTAESTYSRWVPNGFGFDFCAEPPEGPLFTTRMLVVPGAPEQSFLVEKLTSTREEWCRDGHAPRMPPPPMPALEPAQIETIAAWIREGAFYN